MYKFDYVRISDEKDVKQNIKEIKAYLDDMADKLNMLSQQIDDKEDKGGKVNGI